MAIVAFPSLLGDILVEVDEAVSPGLQRVAASKDGLLHVGKNFESALEGIKRVTSAVVRTLEELTPDEAKIEIGFKLNAETGVVLAKAGTESHIKVELTWKRPRKET
jgi:hypothetical protein